MKFLVIDGTLVVGPINDHATLYAVFQTRDLPPELARRTRSGIVEQVWRHTQEGRITGAGGLDFHGKVSSWDSAAFGVTTPPEMHDEIAMEINQLLGTGELKIPPK